MELYFIPTLLPRTITKTEWYSMWREARIRKRELEYDNAAKCNMLTDPKLPKHIRQGIIDELVYPPFLLGPGME